jgi:serine protease Do
MNTKTPPSNKSSRRFGLRAGLLAGVALATLGGVGLMNGLALQFPQAQAQNLTADQPMVAMPSFANIADKVRPAVVSVKVKISEARADQDGDTPDLNQLPPEIQEFLRRFGQGAPNERQGRGARPQTGIALGSGFFISGDGYVVTNNHVVEHATEVTLTTEDGKTLAAKVVGTDPKTDIALLKVQDKGTYPFVKLAPAPPRVGDWVVAVGNPFGLGGTVTAGIVSARGRDIGSGPYDDYLQIDAPVNRGNSGGPTFNLSGEVVGVNTAIASPSGGSVGIAFAIPSTTVDSVMAALKTNGEVSRGYLGVQIQPVSGDMADALGLPQATKGALVADVTKNSAAAEAGIRSGDVITQADSTPIAEPRDLTRLIGGMKPGSTVKLSLIREGKPETVTATLARQPGDKSVASADPATIGGLSLGLTLSRAPGKTGVVVTGVDPDGRAAAQGLREGDVILEVAGHAVSRPEEVRSAVSEARAEGKKAVLMRVKSQEGTRLVALAFPKA